MSAGFLSTPSARRATSGLLSMHLLYYISIHALREEGDSTSVGCVTFWFLFLSTPSARRATGLDFVFSCFYYISIHALREEGDDKSQKCGII